MANCHPTKHGSKTNVHGKPSPQTMKPSLPVSLTQTLSRRERDQTNACANSTLKPCPCGGIDYAACCGRYHDGIPAPDANLLMRSRYSAYVMKFKPYLLATWHPDTRPAGIDFDDGTKWLGLEIRKSPNVHGKGATPDNETRHTRFPHPNPLPEGEGTNERLREFHIYRATVEFVARYKVNGRAHRLHEVSRFVLEDGRWFYLDGSFPA